MKYLGPYKIDEMAKPKKKILVRLKSEPDGKPYEIVADNFDPNRHEMVMSDRPKPRDMFTAQGNKRKAGAFKNPKAYNRKQEKKVNY